MEGARLMEVVIRASKHHWFDQPAFAPLAHSWEVEIRRNESESRRRRSLLSVPPFPVL